MPKARRKGSPPAINLIPEAQAILDRFVTLDPEVRQEILARFIFLNLEARQQLGNTLEFRKWVFGDWVLLPNGFLEQVLEDWEAEATENDYKFVTVVAALGHMTDMAKNLKEAYEGRNPPPATGRGTRRSSACITKRGCRTEPSGTA
jgi:hypothetical protein